MGHRRGPAHPPSSRHHVEASPVERRLVSALRHETGGTGHAKWSAVQRHFIEASTKGGLLEKLQLILLAYKGFVDRTSLRMDANISPVDPDGRSGDPSGVLQEARKRGQRLRREAAQDGVDWEAASHVRVREQRDTRAIVWLS